MNKLILYFFAVTAVLILTTSISVAQKTGFSTQLGFFAGDDNIYITDPEIPSYQGTVSLLYNIHSKYDLMVKIRCYYFIHENKSEYTEVLNHYGLGYYIGGRFYFDKHISETKEKIFYPYFEIFSGLLTDYSETKYYTDFYYSVTNRKESNCRLSYFNCSFGSVIKIGSGINLDANIDLLIPSGIVSANIGLIAEL